MIAIDTAEFLTAFQLRRAVCRALLEQSRRQSTLIDADEYGPLIELLAAKQELIDHLGRLARDQSPLREAWLQNRERISAGDRDRCDAVLAESESLLAAPIAEEQSCSRRIEARRDETRSALHSLSVGVQAQHAYHPVDQPAQSRFDLNL